MSRNHDNSVLKGLLRYDPDEEEELFDMEDEYESRWRREKHRYPKGSHELEFSNESSEEV